MALPLVFDVVLVFSLMFGMYFVGDVNTSSVVEIILAVIWLRRPLLPKVDLPKALLLILLTSTAPWRSISAIPLRLIVISTIRPLDRCIRCDVLLAS